MGRVGIGDPFEEYSKRPLAEHVQDFARYLEGKGDTPKHAAKTCGRVQAILDGCKLALIADISASRVVDFLYQLRTRHTNRQPLDKSEHTKKELA